MHLHIILYFSINYLTRKFFFSNPSLGLGTGLGFLGFFGSRDRSRFSGPIPGLVPGSRVFWVPVKPYYLLKFYTIYSPNNELSKGPEQMS